MEYKNETRMMETNMHKWAGQYYWLEGRGWESGETTEEQKWSLNEED